MARTRAAEIARETTGKELLGAALEVFVEKGYPATTISDIVRVAGVTQGTFYLYYKNKADIFSALLEDYRKLTISGLFDVDLQSVRTKKDWLNLADRISEFLLDHINTHGDFLRLFVAETTTIGSNFLDEANAFSAEVIEEISRLVEYGIKRNILRNIDVEAFALAALGALKEAIHQSCFADVSQRPDEIIPRVIRCQARLLLK